MLVNACPTARQYRVNAHPLASAPLHDGKEQRSISLVCLVKFNNSPTPLQVHTRASAPRSGVRGSTIVQYLCVPVVYSPTLLLITETLQYAQVGRGRASEIVLRPLKVRAFASSFHALRLWLNKQLASNRVLPHA